MYIEIYEVLYFVLVWRFGDQYIGMVWWTFTL